MPVLVDLCRGYLCESRGGLNIALTFGGLLGIRNRLRG